MLMLMLRLRLKLKPPGLEGTREILVVQREL